MRAAIDFDNFSANLVNLEHVLMSVKTNLPWFYDQISVLAIRKATQKVTDCLPTHLISTSKKANDSANTLAEDMLRVELLTEKYSKFSIEGDTGTLRKQPQKYTTVQACVPAESLKCGKVTIKSFKFVNTVDSGLQEHTNNHSTHVHIANSERLIQRMLTLITSIRKAAGRLKIAPNMATTLDEIGFMCRQIKGNTATLTKWITHLNNRRHVARLLVKLRHRGAVKSLLSRVEDEKGKKRVWKF